MKIGIDLDEVVVEFVKTFIDFYNRKYGKKINFRDIKSYNFWENGIGRDRDEAIRLVDEFYNSEKFESMPFVDGAFEGLKVLALRNKIYIITSRPERFKKKTDMFIKKYLSQIAPEVMYSGDFHSQGKTKAEILEEIGADCFIEDNMEYALTSSKKTRKVFLFDKPWNQRESDGKILRVKSWVEILKNLK